MSHYFDRDPGSTHRPDTVEVAAPHPLRLATDSGVFSPRRVDPGTRLLLQTAPLPDAAAIPDGDVVDVGCGYGPIALTLATAAPERRVWAVEPNARARTLCESNAAAHELANVAVMDPDEVPDDLVVAGIWSNPPIRIGKAALHDLLLGWLARLAPGGGAWLVVQRHLGADSLARWLAEQGWTATRLVSRQGYRVLEVRTTVAPDAAEEAR